MSRDFSPQDLGDTDRSPAWPRGWAADSAPGEAESSGLDPASPTAEQTTERPQEDSRPQIRFTNGRALLHDRDRVYDLSESGIHTIADLGRFRLIAPHDLAQHAYAGHLQRARSELGRLVRQGLLQIETFEGPENTPRELVTLTSQGHQLLRANQLVAHDQAIYHGFVKTKDANHDADLYRLYQKEASRIEGQGGKNLRVILDDELKRKVNRDLARCGATAKEVIAARHGLRVVGAKIPIPDLRIEYETPEGEMARVDLELITEHYRGRTVAEKARAGFSLYTPHGEADHLRRVLDRQKLNADVLWL